MRYLSWEDRKMRNVCFKKGLVVGIIALFLGMGVTSTIGISNNDDTIPPVTTHSLEPPVPDGLNDYYISDVTVTLEATDDISGVKEIKYQINDDPVQTIPGDHGTFIISEDSNLHTIKYWAIDNVGNTENLNQFQLKMDQTPPVTMLIYEIVGGSPLQGWEIEFSAEAEDECSCVERVEFYINDVLQETVTGPGPIYEWGLRCSINNVRVCGFIRNLEITEEYVNFTARLVIALGRPGLTIVIEVCAYDFAGNVDCDEWHFKPAIDPGIYLFKDLSLPNFYSGYIGEFFIFALF